MILFIYLISACSSLPYHENYMDQYAKKTRNEMQFIIIKLTEPKSYVLKKWSFNKMILNALLMIFICILIKLVLCICGETFHLESYKSIEYVPNWKS